MAEFSLATTVLVGLLTVFVVRKLLYSISFTVKARRHSCKPAPRYPHKDPILGLDFFMAQFQERKDGNHLTEERRRFARLGRTFEVNSWGTRTIHTMDSQNIREVLGTSFDKFGVQEIRLKVNGSLFGPGVFMTDGQYWVHSRKLLSPMFSRSQVSDFTALDVHLDRMLKRLPRDGSTVELQGLLKLMYLDHSTEMIFGKSTDTLLRETPDESAHELLETFSAALQGIGRRILFGRLWIFILWDRSFEVLASRIRAVVDKYIDEAIERQQSSASTSDKRYIMLDELLKVTDDREEIRNQLLNVFLAGRDAAALGLSMCLFHLARHPDVWNKLRSEVLSIKGPVTRDVLRSMPYMQAVLNETLRLNIPAAGNRRLCTKDCVLPTGGGPDGKSPVFVSKGDMVEVIFGAMHYDKEIWGEDAEQFRPERWIDSKDGSDKYNWTYMPFSAGRRVCLGKEITLTENAYVLMRLVREFKALENRDPVWEFVERTLLVTESRNGVQVGLIPEAV